MEQKKYNIPIVWESYKTYTVEAENLQKAIKLALQTFLKEPDENYLNDSFSIDDIVYDNYPKENYDIHEIYKEL